MKFKHNRSCGDCTACCDGRLVLNIFGKRFTGRPCHYLTNEGCSIYKHRPKDPCKTFNCGWLKDENFKYPEWLKPNKSGLIILDWKKTKSGIPFICVVANGDNYDKKSLLWLIDYCSDNDLNIEFLVGNDKHHMGSKEFRKEKKWKI